MWQRSEDRLLLLELLVRGRAKQRQAQQNAFQTMAELPWTRLTGRRDELALVEERRHELVALLGKVWPDWSSALTELTANGLPPTPDGWSRLIQARRLATLPTLPAQLNRKTAAALLASHSKASLSPLAMAALQDTATTHDGSVRLRVPRGVTARTARGQLDLEAITQVLGEVAIPERALREGLCLEGRIRAVLLVENLGAFCDLPQLDGWLLVHVPGWDTATVSSLLPQLRQIPTVHFGDLDPNGLRIFRHLQTLHPELRWFVPAFWEELVATRGLRGDWPQDLDWDDAPAWLQQLAAQGLWLEQEAIVLDTRLANALEAMLEAAGPPALDSGLGDDPAAGADLQ